MSRYSLATSIFNRLTGLLLSGALLLLIYWLLAVAGGADAFARAARVLSSPALKVIYAVTTVAFSYHLVAGLRHLVWDTGRGLERTQSRLSAYVVVAVSAVLVVLILFYAFFAAARAP